MALQVNLLRPSIYKCLLLVPPGFNFNNSTLCPQNALICFVRTSEPKGTISSCSINLHFLQLKLRGREYIFIYTSSQSLHSCSENVTLLIIWSLPYFLVLFFFMHELYILWAGIEGNRRRREFFLRDLKIIYKHN